MGGRIVWKRLYSMSFHSLLSEVFRERGVCERERRKRHTQIEGEGESGVCCLCLHPCFFWVSGLGSFRSSIFCCIYHWKSDALPTPGWAAVWGPLGLFYPHRSAAESAPALAEGVFV